MSKNPCLCLLGALVLLSIASPCLAAQDAQVSFGWRYALDGDVRAMAAGDLDNDGVKELVAASGDKIYVLNSSGGVRKTVSVGFTPTIVAIADVDNDSINEVVVGSGWVNRTNLTVRRFNFTDVEDIVEHPTILHEVIRNQGELYVIQEDSYAAALWLNMMETVRGFSAADVDNDGVVEFIVLSGGVNMDLVERSVKEPSPPRVIDHYLIGTNEDICGELTARNENASIECMFFIVPSTDRFYYIGRFWDGYMDVNETLPPRFPERYVRNLTYEYSDNYSVSIYSDERTLLSSYKTNKTLMALHVAQVTLGNPPVILTGEEEVLVVKPDGSMNASYKPPGANYSIRWIQSASLSDERYNDILVGFRGPGLNGVYVLDKGGEFSWQFRDVSKNVVGVLTSDLDGDLQEDVVLVLDRKAYVLNATGGVKWTQMFSEDIDWIALVDYRGSGVFDYVLASRSAVIDYRIDEGFIRLRGADAQLKRAAELSSLGRYEEALVLLSKARQTYVETSDFDMVSKCDVMKAGIENSLNSAKKEAASSLYKKGRSEFYLGLYNESRENIGKARLIYLEIGDDDGVSRCDDALGEIAEALAALATTTIPQTTTTSQATTTTAPKQEYDLSQVPLILSLLAATALVFIWIGVSEKKRKEKKKEKKGEYGAEGMKPLEKM